ncbi:mu-protocadherin [Neorhodopirellula lusitana]|uniref:mu-protocadherin n=1 Tax=Neorhodopirellula lusitana TaxID=445327 RepID=UPI00384B72A6
MVGAVMLLIAASAGITSIGISTVGITYGWTPDGGRGVKYIIQIPPEKVDQVVRSGEIASQIPTEIRGHVSEVVIRIGQGTLPRVTPNHLTQAGYQTPVDPSAGTTTGQLAAEDRFPMPIPSMGDAARLTPIRARSEPATAMMKPAPQGGGMNLPGSLGPPSLGTGAASNASNQFNSAAESAYQQAQQNLNQAADRMGQTAGSQMQSVADQAREAITNRFNTDPDDPRTRLLQNDATAPRNQNTAANSSAATNPYARSSATRPSTNPVSATATAKDSTEQDWYDLRNGPRRRPSTDPVDSSSSLASRSSDATANPNSGPSAFDNSGFGRLPSGLDSNGLDSRGLDSNRSQTAARNQSTTRGLDPTRARDSGSGLGSNSGLASSDDRFGNPRSANTNLDYDPRLTAVQAQQLPPGGYSFDGDSYPIDRQGYRLNRYGERVDTTSSNSLASNQQNTSPYGQATNGQSTNPRDTTSRNSYGDNRNQNQYGSTANSNDARAGQNNVNPNAPNYGSPNSYANNNAYPGSNNYSQPNGYPQPGQGNQAGQGNQSGQGNQLNPGQFNTNMAGYPYNNTQLVQPPMAPTQGNYPQTNAYPGMPATNQYAGPSQMGMGIGMGAYPQLTDPRLASLTGQTTNTSAQSGTTGTNSSRADSDLRGSDETLISDRDRLSRSRDLKTNPDQVAAQPIFNGMLLLSIVTNVYLFFWLNNMRLRFRDTVASKRSANSGSPLAAST